MGPSHIGCSCMLVFATLENLHFKQEKEKSPPTTAAPWCLWYYAMQVVEGMFVFKRVFQSQVW